jgi:hypothetical protein
VTAVVCDWKGWGKHLVSLLLPDAVMLPVAPLHDPDALLEQVVACGAAPAVVLMHVDNTFPGRIIPGIGEFALKAARAGIPVWNHRVRDISKHAVQAHNVRNGLGSTTAGRTGSSSERLIVKTSLNHHGVIEARMSADERRILGWAPYARTAIQAWPDYPVMPRAEIPEAWWTDPQLQIERVVSNTDNALYRMYFAGENCVLRVGTSNAPVLRLAESSQYCTYLLLRELAEDPITAMLLGERASAVFGCATRFARSYGVDYATIDLVADDDNNAFVVDLNPCPFWGADDGDDDADFVVGHLAAGFSGSAKSSNVSGAS